MSDQSRLILSTKVPPELLFAAAERAGWKKLARSRATATARIP